MTLLLPMALLGLLTLPAIVLLHLMRNRRELRSISSLRLWQGLAQQQRGGLPRSLPLSWLLLLQLLAASAITLALAQPVFSYVLTPARHTVFILDTSTSMTAATDSGINESPRYFDEARNVILAHVQSMNGDDSVAVVTLSSQPEVLLTGTAAQKSVLLLALDNLVPGATGANISAALTLANGLLNPNRLNQIVVLTDGNLVPDSVPAPFIFAPVNWQLFSAEASTGSNQALINVSSRPLPDGRHRVFANVVNYGNAPVSRTVRLYADDLVAAEESVQVDLLSTEEFVWILPAQTQTATVEIVEPDALILDNRAELFLSNQTVQRVLLVSETPDTLERALMVQPAVDLTVVAPDNRDSQNPADFDLIVFDGLLPETTTWPQGNLLVVAPPANHPLLPANDVARSLRPNPGSVSPLLNGIELSGVYFNQVPLLALPPWAAADLEGISGGEEPAAALLIFHGAPGNGSHVMVWNFDLSATNLPGRVALPLLTANTLSTLLAPSPPATVMVGEPVPLPGDFTVKTPDGYRLFLETGDRDALFSFTKQPGLYKIYNQHNQLVAGFAVHAGSPLESNLSEPLQPETLNHVQVIPAGEPFAEILLKEYWIWFAAAAFVLIIFEGWLAWRR